MLVLSAVFLFWLMLLAISVIGALLVVKYVPREAKVSHRPLTQQSLAVAGMMFVIVEGFFISQALRDYSAVHTGIVNEANSLGQVFRNARGLPETDRKRIRNLCRRYVDSVLTDEWPMLAQMQASDKTQQIVNELWDATLSVQPTNLREQTIYQSCLSGMNEFGGSRRIRTAVNAAGFSFTFWIIIAVGASSIIILTYLFEPDNNSYHVAILACLLIPLTLNVYMLADFSHPFSGIITVKPVMFERLRERIMTEDDSAPRFLSKP